MCFAALATLPAISSLVGLAGTAVSAVGQIQQGQAAQKAADFRAKNNQMLAEDALKRGAEEEEAQRRKNNALLGRQKAVMAAGNVDIGSGSPLNILGDTAMLGELDAMRIRENAKREEQALLADAQVAKMEGDSASNAATMGAFGTILGGTKDLLSSSWYKTSSNSSSGWNGLRTVTGS